MIRNESTSQIIASKNGDRDELLKLALRLTDRLLNDIVPAITGAINNSGVPIEFLEYITVRAIVERASNKADDISVKAPTEKLFDIWDKMFYEENEPYAEAYQIHRFLSDELHKK